MKALYLLGRLVFGGFFLYNGINHFQNQEQLTQYAKAKNVPLPGAMIPVTGTLLTLGGASLLLGIKPKYGAMAIVGILAGVSPIMHDFWSHEDPGQRQNEMINFSKNVALLGAALALGAAEDAGRGRQSKGSGNVVSMARQESRGRKHSHRMAA